MCHHRMISASILAVLVLAPCQIGWSRGMGGGGGGRGGFSGGGEGNRGGGGGAQFNRGGEPERQGGNRGGQGGDQFDRSRSQGGDFNRGGDFGSQGGNRYGQGGEQFGRGNQQGGEAGRPSRGETGSAPSKNDLNSFLGIPSDEGMSHGNRNNVSGAGGAAAGAAASNRNNPNFSGAQGAAVGAAASNRNNPNFSGAQGAAVGAAASNRNGYGYVAPSARYGTATAVRGGYNNYGLYGTGWRAANPGAWAATGWAAGTAWNTANWNTAGAWCGYQGAYPMYYDYGNNVTNQGNEVFVNGQDSGSSSDYYNQAASLATTGVQADAPSDADWLPLGVFAATRSGETSSHLTLQLAVNKQGILRGNLTDSDANSTQPIKGSVDKQTQKVAFTIGDDTSRVIETGLYNLTKDEAPALVHLGPDNTEQWLLARLTNPNQNSTNQ